MSPTAVESWKAHDTPNIAASWIVAMWVEGAWRFVTFEVEARARDLYAICRRDWAPEDEIGCYRSCGSILTPV